VTTSGHDLGRISFHVNRLAWNPDARRRFQRKVDDDVLPTTDASQDAAGVVAEETLRRHLVAVLRALLLHHAETGTDLHALHGIDAHHGVGEVGVEAIEDRFAQAHRHTTGNHRDLGADGIALLVQ